MSDIFEQPWTLVFAGFIVLIIVWIWQAVFFDKSKVWQWFIPAVIVIAGFGLDYFIKTDTEKIHGKIKTLVEAAEEEDCETIGKLISEDYGDSHHNSKRKLLNY